VLPEQVGAQVGGASGAASSLDAGASPCDDMSASGIVDDALVEPHQPPEHCWPSRHCSSDEHAIDGSLSQPAIASSTPSTRARI
jgi:hypothetical protein